jgi:tRNA (cytidine/uridine-2'-O-)-methyltransferase
MFNVVLFQPEIPQNTGNIGRLCVGTTCTLHLIKPLGFSLEDKYMKRAGLDYWQHLTFKIYENFDDFLTKNNPQRIFFLSKKTDKPYWDEKYKKGDYFVFGRETKGLPDEIMEKYKNKLRTIPMLGKTRSLNLSNSVSIVVYEALRQIITDKF